MAQILTQEEIDALLKTLSSDSAEQEENLTLIAEIEKIMYSQSKNNRAKILPRFVLIDGEVFQVLPDSKVYY
jgi:flagellar motor switch protein FliM